MISLRQLLIWSSLSLATGYAAPAYCQTGEGWGHGLARTHTANPSCVYEQSGFPFSGLYGWGDFYEWGDCSDPDLYHRWSFGPAFCWSGGWSMANGGLAWWHARTEWAPTGELVAFSAFSAEAGNMMGEWSGEVPAITWADFTAGTPIHLPLEFEADGFLWTWLLGGYDQFGVPDPVALFRAAYGCSPWNACVVVHAEWLGGGLLFRDEQVYGGNVRLSVQVVPFDDADWNRDGQVSFADIFAFLDSWFRGEPRAAACDGARGCWTTDIFAFLAEWYAS